METRDVERLARLTKEVVELGATLALVPIKMVLRHLLPGGPSIEQERWTPAADEDGGVVGDVTVATGGKRANGAASAPSASASAEPAAPASARPRARRRASRPAPVPPSPHVNDLTSADAARIREAEREAEASPDGPGPELRVAAPWPGYDEMNIAQVLDRLTGADQTTRAMVRLYEETHKNRKGVLRATE